MTWICPECNKEFRNKNQWHSCARVDLEAHLRNKSPQVRAIVEKLMKGLHKFGTLTINPVKTSIQVKAGATFLSIRPKRDHVEIEFQLPLKVDEFPVYRTVGISRNRTLHFAIIETPREVDARLMGWLRQSYEMVSA